MWFVFFFSFVGFFLSREKDRVRRNSENGSPLPTHLICGKWNIHGWLASGTPWRALRRQRRCSLARQSDYFVLEGRCTVRNTLNLTQFVMVYKMKYFKQMSNGVDTVKAGLWNISSKTKNNDFLEWLNRKPHRFGFNTSKMSTSKHFSWALWDMTFSELSVAMKHAKACDIKVFFLLSQALVLC